MVVGEARSALCGRGSRCEYGVTGPVLAGVRGNDVRRDTWCVIRDAGGRGYVRGGEARGRWRRMRDSVGRAPPCTLWERKSGGGKVIVKDEDGDGELVIV